MPMLKDSRDSPPSFMVKYLSLNDGMCLHVGLLLVRTGFATYICMQPVESALHIFSQASFYPRTQALGGRGKERAWYPLFAHALNFPEILGNR